MAKSHKLSIHIFALFYNLDNILRADAVAVLHIHARLVGNNHALLKDGFFFLRLILPAQPMRSFMDIQDIPYAMASAMFVIQRTLPERFPCDYVKIPPSTAGQKPGICQPQHGTGDFGKMHLHLVCHRAERNRPGHICCSALILSTRVNQIKAICPDGVRMLLCRTVMRHRRICLVSTYRLERQIQESRNFSPHCIQLFRHAKFIHRNLSGIFLHPEQKFCQHHTVLKVTSPDVFQLDRIFDCL